jgi:hypothetical protein
MRLWMIGIAFFLLAGVPSVEATGSGAWVA